MSTSNKETGNSLSYLNIAISEHGLSELNNGKRTIFIPKEQVKSVEIKYGFQAENPMTQVVFGLSLTALGFFGIIFLKNSGFTLLRMGLGFIFVGGLGAFCLYEGAKKGYYLDVISENDRRKLVFKGAVEKDSLLSFVSSWSRFGYNFQSHLIDTNIR